MRTLLCSGWSGSPLPLCQQGVSSTRDADCFQNPPAAPELKAAACVCAAECSYLFKRSMTVKEIIINKTTVYITTKTQATKEHLPVLCVVHACVKEHGVGRGGCMCVCVYSERGCDIF